MRKGRPLVSKSRRVERAGVREVSGFFEDRDCVVQPVAGENDFGKDLYVELTEESYVTGLVFAVQVKSGRSYKASDGYRIPIDQHWEYWRESILPVVGIVWDPEPGAMYWVNITQFLRENTGELSTIPVSIANELRGETVQALEDSVRATARNQLHPLVEIWSPEITLANEAVWDCFVLGRFDRRILIGLRSALVWLHDEVLPSALRVLSMMGNHPDIGWSENNTIDPDVSSHVRSTFSWSVAEITRMVRAAEDNWERGSLGQSVIVLLGEDESIRSKLLAALRETYPSGESWILFCLLLHFAGSEAATALNLHIEEFPSLRQELAFRDVVDAIDECGELPIAD